MTLLCAVKAFMSFRVQPMKCMNRIATYPPKYEFTTKAIAYKFTPPPLVMTEVIRR